LTAQLRSSKKVDDPTIDRVLDELEGRNILARDGGAISTTPEGTRLFEQLSDQVDQLVTQMWEGLDSTELATAARVLRAITQRANALLAD
jgi:DNA-binding MarR family transcriptional regulator